MQWDHVLAGRLAAMDTREFPAVQPVPGMIALSGGSPATETFPIEGLAEAFRQTVLEEGRAALHYGPADGVPALREDIARLMAGRGVAVDPDDVLIVNGALQGLDITCRVLLDPGESIIVEGPTFIGALTTFRGYEPRMHVVPVDDYGMQVEETARLLKDGLRPRFIYVLPTFHNPAGVTMTQARRQRLLDLSREYEVPLLEDDPYGEIWFGEVPPVTPIRGMAGGEDVIFVSTFSKVLAPGLRLGWIVRPKAIASRFALAKRGADLSTDQVLQRAVHRWLSSVDLPRHLDGLRRVYEERARTMLTCLDQHMPPGVRWTRPEGGFFIWVTLPEGADATALLQEAVREGVMYVPGGGFFADGTGQNTLRLAFSQATHEQIEEAIGRLGRVLTAYLARTGLDQPARVPGR